MDKLFPLGEVGSRGDMTLEEFLQEWNNDSERVLVHTSGSTGKPKPIWVEKRRMEASARITCDFLGLKEGDTALLCMSLDYIAGKMMVVRSLVRNLKLIVVEPTGHPMGSPPAPPNLPKGEASQTVTSTAPNIPLRGGQRGASDFPPSGGLRGASDFPPSGGLRGARGVPFFAAMVPLQVYNSLQVPEERERLRQIKHLIIGGGAIDDTLAHALHDFPNAVWSTYGMTETLSHIALRRLNGPEASEWYTPFPSVEISQNADGCLVIDAPLVCEQTLVTNDIVEISSVSGADGHPLKRFRIIGRKDNVICSGGIKIQIEEVERALRPYMPVPFMITKRKDEKFGEVVVMLVQERGEIQEKEQQMEQQKEQQKERQEEQQKEQQKEQELAHLCEEHLPKYWQPHAYVFVAELPMTETGKPARKKAEEIVNLKIGKRGE